MTNTEKFFYKNDKFGVEYKFIIKKNYFKALKIDSIQCFYENNEVGFVWVKYSKNNADEALVSYVRIIDEYQGKGLSQLMYFYISQYVNGKGFVLTNSMCQTESGKLVWKYLYNNFPQSITISTDDLGFDKFYLNIPLFKSCNFEHGKLIHNL